MSGRLISFRTLIGVAVGLIGFAVIAIGLTVFALRNDALSDATREADNIATVLAEEGTASIQSIEIVAGDIRDQVLRRGGDDAARIRDFMRSQETFAALRERRGFLGQTDAIALIDAEGRLAATSRFWPTPPTDLSDRDYFRHLKATDDHSLFISDLTMNRVSGAPTVFFAKRIGSGAEFHGVVLVGVQLSYFQRLYNSISSLRDQSFLFLRRDGTVLIRHPDPIRRTGEKMPPDSPWHGLVAAGGGQYRSPGYFDGEPRLVAVRPLRDYPLVVNVAVTEASALKRWQHRALLIGLGTAIAILCFALLLRALSTHVRRLVDSEAEIAEKSRELMEANATLDSALHDMTHGLAMFDQDENLVICNERYLQMYNLSAEDVKPGCSLRRLLELRRDAGNFIADIDAYMANRRARMARGESICVITHLGDGRVVAVHSRHAKNGGWVATHEDITERERAEARIAHMARHDALTDLANRVLFRERMEEALARLRNDGHPFAVLVFDLDRFKSVNDTLGHPIGDALLRVVAQRLLSIVRRGDTVGRLGGDEFAIIQLANGDARTAASALAERLLKTIGAPFQVEGHELVIGTSIGIALAPDDGTDADDLLKNADLALYRAKSDGRQDYRFFEAQMDSELRLRRSLEIDLRHALMHGEFEIHYQPVIDVTTRKPDGAEALTRWWHPLHGLIRPDRFIPLAEETGLIVPLGEWLLRRACADAAKWPSTIKLAVNLSPVQFRDGNLAQVVQSALAESGLAPGRLELEITESVLLQQNAANLDILHQLKKLGVGIVLDDFGTGYSSLRYLQMFPFDKIKIDRSFVAEMPHRLDCAAIVCAITGLARNLAIETTAEGVETDEQFMLLRAAGCTHAQGFLFSRPRPAADLDFSAAGGDAGRGAAA